MRDNCIIKVVQETSTPIFDLTPHQIRMATCYRDRIGIYHLFTDYIDKKWNTVDSWRAEIRYYVSKDLRNWKYIATPVAHGRADEADGFGAASPHVLPINDKILLFYAGRQIHDTTEMNCFAQPGTRGYMSGSIMMSIADSDANGTPNGSFKKHGVVLESGIGWDSMRLDDPCAILEGDTVHLYYKGFDSNTNLNNICVGRSSAKLQNLKFTAHPKPVLAVSGGGEMPRVFLTGKRWNMLYRHFDGPGKPYSWHCHKSEDGIKWTQNPINFFNGRQGPSDIMLIYQMNGELQTNPGLLVAGSDNGIQKLWLYRVEINTH